MRLSSSGIGAAALLLAAGMTALPSGGANAASCTGTCGTSNAVDGDVTLSPFGGAHQWISTTGGATGGGTLAGVSGGLETNGSTYTTSAFVAAAGETLSYYFNYITSDGAGFVDYAWAQLRDFATGDVVSTLLTARTKSSGSIIPGDGMPAIDATLTPPTVEIIGGAPDWSPLGGYSGECWDDGCGYTGWVHSEFDVLSAGTYVLVFGVSNWADTLYDSGLAFGGIKIGDVVVDPIPIPAALPLFLGALGGLGFFGWRKKRQSSHKHPATA